MAYSTSTYVLSGTIAIVLSWMMTGCLDFDKFGNQFEPGDAPPNPDQISGYYQSQATTLTFCSGLVDGESLRCAPKDLEHVPAFLKSLMGNPVGVILDDLDGNGRIFNPALDPTPTLPTAANIRTGALNYSGSASPEPIWVEGFECTRRLFVAEEGQIERYPEPVSEDWSEKPIYGKLAITFTVVDEIAGEDCDSALQEMASCYENASLCGGADETENQQLQAYSQAVFGDWVDSGALNFEDIPKAELLLYEVSYQ